MTNSGHQNLKFDFDNPLSVSQKQIEDCRRLGAVFDTYYRLLLPITIIAILGSVLANLMDPVILGVVLGVICCIHMYATRFEILTDLDGTKSIDEPLAQLITRLCEQKMFDDYRLKVIEHRELVVGDYLVMKKRQAASPKSIAREHPAS